MRRPPVVVFSSIDWDFNWQTHQEVTSRLARRGYPVLFIENTGVRRPQVMDVGRIGRRLLRLFSSRVRRRRPIDGLDVCAPWVVPLPYSRTVTAANAVLLGRTIRRWLSGYREQPIVWTYLPTPLVLGLARRLGPSLLVYHCVDDLPASSLLARQAIASENILLAEADLVLVTSDALRRKAEKRRLRAHVIRSGVDGARFAESRGHALERPCDVPADGRPIVGYVGGLHRWFDVRLAVEVASLLPEVQFVFVGPELCDVSPLRQLPNVRLVGGRPHHDIPAYLQVFDAAIIPYVIDDYTASVFPAKLNEYLAMGLPVISTPLPEVLAFLQDAGRVVEVASTARAFTDALRRTLSTADPVARARRVTIARQNDWTHQFEQMDSLLQTALAGRVGL